MTWDTPADSGRTKDRVFPVYPRGLRRLVHTDKWETAVSVERCS